MVRQQDTSHYLWPLPGRSTPIGVLSHRGRAGNPGDPRDNTLAAFAAALASGADGVELDVRRTADGVAVVHHDAEVAGAGPLSQLRSGDLPSWIPTLEEALVACAGAAVDVEVKSSPLEPGYDPAERLATEVADLVAGLVATARGPARVFVSCFFGAALQAARAERPELATGLLVLPGDEAGSALARARAVGARVLLPFATQVTAELVEAAHGHGLAVVPWAVDEEADLRAVARVGVDAVITDHPGRARTCLGRT